MTEVTLIGIDLAKRIFHFCAMDVSGRIVWERRLQRKKVLQELARIEPCAVAMEACGGAHYWGRAIGQLGHRVCLIHPRRVAAFVGAHKNDTIDGRAICEAARQPTTRFIPVKSLAQQDLQSLSRLRDGLVNQRTASINRLRGLLAEYGIVLPRGRHAGLGRLRELMAAPDWGAEMAPALVNAIEEERGWIDALSTRIGGLDRSLGKQVAAHQHGAHLMTIPGVGPMTAALLGAAVGDADAFASARQFAAWIGLVPRQETTGGRVRLKGITKHGNSHLRRNLIHGARAVVAATLRREQARSRLERWILEHAGRLPRNVLVVAVANKMARIAWVLMTRAEVFRAEPAAA